MMLTTQDIVIRLLISLAFGALVGLEREVKECPAGLRTHSLVCVGATVFTMVSLLLGGPNVDISRIAGQVVVGIGFIGGGVIFKAKNRVIGLSTAASLWIAAALGLVAGIGQYYLGVLTLGITLFILLVGTHVEKTFFHKKKIN
ncbi:MgtC/SapB family protein [Candidatus Woesearchaeota archaeon]|nr:MgtC/SapB family protein [Candidatus Woesearchaeota archaeon]